GGAAAADRGPDAAVGVRARRGDGGRAGGAGPMVAGAVPIRTAGVGVAQPHLGQTGQQPDPPGPAGRIRPTRIKTPIQRQEEGKATRTALCQISVSDGPVTNLERARDMLADAARGDARIAILPEATLCRFVRRITELAQPLDGPFVTGLAEAARSHGISVIAGVFEPEQRR